MAADRLLGVVEVAAVRSVAGFTEAELLRGLCSAQMKATALAGALLNKAAAAKGEVRKEREKLGEQKKLEEAQKACTVANERWDEAMTCNEDLRAQSIKEKEEADLKIAGLERDLADERARAAAEKARLEKELTKAASERAAYPDLCVAAVEQFKGSADFQMAVDAAIANNLAREGSGGAGPSGATAGSRSEEEVI
ncbi:uncharacterized protein LOC114308802 [Camellia sinensis]|uniref:uncharacterized protein LOC114308802 n=1 Tax=Camellia sinensis TaxID=4442 RepID=UPI0010359FA5|nr:uncharacterized protein LOC114308802 [Camellia sinensis]